MVAMIDNVIQTSQIYFTRISKWKSKADLKIETGPYVLKFATTKKEVIDCFKLRHQVFCVEMAGQSKKSRLDFDKYDNFCDHLIIVHQPTEKIVGTYRMNFSETSDSFYTESEFHLNPWINKQDAPFIELGRACIEKDHRRGIVISLLWRGIADYMKLMNAEKLIGCSSIKVTDARSAALVYKYFEAKGALTEEIFQPKDKFVMDDLQFWLNVFSSGLTEQQMQDAEEMVPSLLKSYIKAGSKVASLPAFDEEFSCIDFVTILNRADLDQKLVRRFSP
jgi:putative hemolysin